MDGGIEEQLTGGHDSGPVTRIGSTVRRPVRPWTPSVHSLLRHLESIGFDASPRVIDMDEHGRETLTYIDGLDGRKARCYDDRSLRQVAQMVSRLHEALATFVPAKDSVWRPDPRAPTGNLICHNDLSPANTIYRNGEPWAFIDWDFATPTTLLWDLSYAVRTFVPLYSSQDCVQMGYEPELRTERLRLFCDAYGMDAATRRGLLPSIRTRLEAETTAFSQRCSRSLAQHWSEWQHAAMS